MSKQSNAMNDLETSWIDDIESGQIKSDKTKMKQLSGKLIVDRSLKKSHPISMRIPESDMEAIQLKAAKAGIPCQTLIKSILHKFAIE